MNSSLFMVKLGAVTACVVAAFFYGRSVGIDKVTVKCQAQEIKRQEVVNDVVKNAISKRPINRNALIDKLRAKAADKRKY